ncbi:MAG: hypothetical protein R2991_06430 [Thermoanaerobaculia bacterium]
MERSARLGAAFLERLQAIDSPHVHEVRGRGLWIDIELTREAGGAPFLRGAAGRGNALQGDPRAHHPRRPALVITEEEIDWAVEQLARAHGPLRTTTASGGPRASQRLPPSRSRSRSRAPALSAGGCRCRTWATGRRRDSPPHSRTPPEIRHCARAGPAASRSPLADPDAPGCPS